MQMFWCSDGAKAFVWQVAYKLNYLLISSCRANVVYDYQTFEKDGDNMSLLRQKAAKLLRRTRVNEKISLKAKKINLSHCYLDF